MHTRAFQISRSKVKSLQWAILALLFNAIASTFILAATEDLQTHEVQEHENAIINTFDATVEAVNKATLSAQTTGRITEIYFDVEDYVAKGSTVVRLRDKDQQAQVSAAKAKLDEAVAKVSEAEKEYNRLQDVYNKKLVAKSVLDKAEANLKSAQQRVEQAKALLLQAKEQLERTRIRAPYGGIVTQRHVEVGETAKVGQAIMTGFSLDKLRVYADIPQSLVAAVSANKLASVIHESKEYTIPSEQVSVYPFSDPNTHSFRVRVDLTKEIVGLLPGMMVKLAFRTGKYKQLVVPTATVVQRSELTGVYVIAKSGQVFLRQIRVGRKLDGQYFEVISGLEIGEKVALNPIAAGVELKSQQAQDKK